MSSTMTAHGITVTIDVSEASDGAPVVFVDTDGVPEGDRGPLIRVRVNDEPVFVGVDRGDEPDLGGGPSCERCGWEPAATCECDD